MRAWRHWMKQVSRSWKECKEEPAFSCTSTITKQYKVTYFYITLLVLWLIFFLLLFVSSFTPPSFLCSPIFSFLLGCCVILTSEVPSALTGEAAGELGCIECQAASMFKTEGGGREDKKKTSSFSSGGFLAALLISSRDACHKGENSLQGTKVLPSKNCQFHF